MTIHELLAQFESKTLKVQFLAECMSNLNAGKKSTKVTFETDAITPNSVVSETDPVGIVIWIPRDEWKKRVKP